MQSMKSQEVWYWKEACADLGAVIGYQSSRLLLLSQVFQCILYHPLQSPPQQVWHLCYFQYLLLWRHPLLKYAGFFLTKTLEPGVPSVYLPLDIKPHQGSNLAPSSLPMVSRPLDITYMHKILVVHLRHTLKDQTPKKSRVAMVPSFPPLRACLFLT